MMYGALSVPQAKPVADGMIMRDGVWQGGIGETLPAGAVFTRATPAYGWKGASLMGYALPNIARCEVDPLTLGYRGVLMENGSTNYVRLNRALTNAWWGKAGASVATTSVPCMDGSTSMFKLIEDTADSEHELYRELTVTAGHFFAVAVDVKAAEQEAVCLTLRNAGNTHACSVIYDLATESMSASVMGSGVVLDKMMVKVAADGVYRCCLVGRASATDTLIRVGFGVVNASLQKSYAGNGTSGIYVALPQVEIGTTVDMCTSFIVNDGTGSDMTRSGDVLRWPDINALGFDTTKGTVVVDFMLAGKGSANNTRRIVELSANAANRIDVSYNPSWGSKISLAYRYNNVPNNLAVNGSGTLQALTGYRVALGYSGTQVAVSFMGQPVQTASVSGAVPLTELRLGNSGYGNVMLGGWIRRAVYYPTDLLNLTSLSAL